MLTLQAAQVLAFAQGVLPNFRHLRRRRESGQRFQNLLLVFRSVGAVTTRKLHTKVPSSQLLFVLTLSLLSFLYGLPLFASLWGASPLVLFSLSVGLGGPHYP